MDLVAAMERLALGEVLLVMLQGHQVQIIGTLQMVAMADLAVGIFCAMAGTERGRQVEAAAEVAALVALSVYL